LFIAGCAIYTEFFTSPTNDNKSGIGMNIIAPDSKSNASAPSSIYFAAYDGRGRDKMETSAPVNRCLTCHRAGIMPIAQADPANSSVFSYSKQHSSTEIISWFNRSVAPLYANVNMAGANTVDIPLPQIGEVNPPGRTDDFINYCAYFAGQNKRIGAIKSAMNCANCHDGDSENGVGKVSFMSLDFSSYDYMNPPVDADLTIKTLIENGVMPPNNDLTDKERKDLYVCLKMEYYSGFSKFVDMSNFEMKNPKMIGTFLRKMSENKCPTGESKQQ
jgi:hypothetical protein